MNNKQLKINIERLDLRIAKLGTEIEALGNARGYESKLNTLTDLMNLRGTLVKTYGGTESDVIIELDRQINELAVDVKNYERDDEYQSKIKDLDSLTKVRCQLAESRIKGSHMPALISGLFGISAMLLVLNYEKTDIVTSKAFGMVSSVFRGN